LLIDLFKRWIINNKFAIALSALFCRNNAAFLFIYVTEIGLASRSGVHEACEVAIICGVIIELATYVLLNLKLLFLLIPGNLLIRLVKLY
jgi:hypothetical protein